MRRDDDEDPEVLGMSPVDRLEDEIRDLGDALAFLQGRPAAAENGG